MYTHILVIPFIGDRKVLRGGIRFTFAYITDINVTLALCTNKGGVVTTYPEHCHLYVT